MISLPYVKTRLKALLDARTELTGLGVAVLYGPSTKQEDLRGTGATYDAQVTFGDNLGTETADIVREESCGWVEEYDLTVHIQIGGRQGTQDFAAIETVRRQVAAAVIAVTQEPTLGRQANPDPLGYVTDLRVSPSSSTAATFLLQSEAGGITAGTVCDIAVEVRAHINHT
jgi:hypothetical protein